MAILQNQYDAEQFDDDTVVVTIDDANTYAREVATEAINAYIAQSQTADAVNTKEPIMANTELNKAASEVAAETQLSVKLVSGEILLDNIQTVAERLVLSRLKWWEKLTITSKKKEMAVTLATYALVKVIQTGGFGLTKYRINHAALEYVTLAANQRMIKYFVTSLGVNTNVAEMFLQAPELVTAEG